MNDRLRDARTQAGFATISDAVKAFGWNYSTYAGHENGHRGAKLPDVEKYAAAFGVSSDWLLRGKPEGNIDQNPTARPRAQGFAESDVLPFHPQSDTLRRKLIDLAKSISPHATQLTFYEIMRHHPTLMLMKGDVLVIDQKRLTLKKGGLVLSQLANEQTGSSATLLRIQDRDGLQAPFGEDELGPDEVEAAIGSVVCSLRVSG